MSRLFASFSSFLKRANPDKLNKWKIRNLTLAIPFGSERQQFNAEGQRNVHLA